MLATLLSRSGSLRRGAEASTLAVSLVVVPALLVGQSTVRVTGGATCATCKLTIREEASVPDEIGIGKMNGYPTIARDRRGRLYFSGALPTIFVYEKSKQVAKFGRKGGGPGEYQHPVVAAEGDTIRVFDASAGRQTVLGPGLKVARVVPMAHADGTVEPAGGDLYFTTNMQPREKGADGPLLLVDRTGKVARSIGAPAKSFIESYRAISMVKKGQIWSSYINRYEIERWDTAGKQTAHVVREAPWFSAWSEMPQGSPNLVPPRPMIAAIHEDRRGLLWVLINVPGADWKKRATSELHGIPVYEKDEFYDSIIEVIDPVRGVVVASQRFPQWMHPRFIDEGYVSSYVEDDDGILLIKVWSVELTGLK
jgi:hypothetical protein